MRQLKLFLPVAIFKLNSTSWAKKWSSPFAPRHLSFFLLIWPRRRRRRLTRLTKWWKQTSSVTITHCVHFSEVFVYRRTENYTQRQQPTVSISQLFYHGPGETYGDNGEALWASGRSWWMTRVFTSVPQLVPSIASFSSYSPSHTGAATIVITTTGKLISLLQKTLRHNFNLLAIFSSDFSKKCGAERQKIWS